MATSIHPLASRRLRSINLMLIAAGAVAITLNMASAWRSEGPADRTLNGSGGSGATNLAVRGQRHPSLRTTPRPFADPIMLQVELAEYEALGDMLAMAR